MPFRPRVSSSSGFRRNAALEKPDEIDKAHQLGNYVLKEMMTLIRLHRYRMLLKMYDADFDWHHQQFHTIMASTLDRPADAAAVPVQPANASGV